MAQARTNMRRQQLYARRGVMARPPARESGLTLSRRRANECHDHFVCFLYRSSIPALRTTLGLVFLWFGLLKLFGASPVTAILEQTYPFVPVKAFVTLLGVWEVAVGCGLICKRALRCALVLMWAHMTGTFVSVFMSPSLFFQHGSPLWLTVEGEFVVKNLVLMAAGLVIGGYEVAPVGVAETHDGPERATKGAPAGPNGITSTADVISR